MTVQNKPSKLIKGATGDWEVVVGMEVHAQVTSNAKLFSGASTEFGGEPNSHVSLVDAAMPGMLPVINEECVRQAIRTGLALNADIKRHSVFDRKNYFYPDLPQGYQISQYKQPIVGEGKVTVAMPSETVVIGIERLHLEQDAGKSLHDQHPDMSAIDLNRAGVALMEIVSKPEIYSPQQAMAFITELREILRDVGSCDGDMEKGRLRADVNVSVHRPGEPLGTRCEIKNLNSIQSIGQAIEYEAHRQIEILERGGVIEQETRLFDAELNETRSMRSKEEAHDYRYFPDPDLLPLNFSDEYVEQLRGTLPETRPERIARFRNDFGLPGEQPERLTLLRGVAEAYDRDVFEYVRLRHGDEAARIVGNAYGRGSRTLAKQNFEAFAASREAAEPYHKALMEGAANLANMVLGMVFAKANELRVDPTSHVARLKLPQFVVMILDGEISGSIAKELFEIVWAEGGEPRIIVEQRGMRQLTNVGEVEKLVDDVLDRVRKSPKEAKNLEAIRANPNVLGWFVGQVMKASGGKANPQAVNDLLKKKLGV